MPMIEITNDMHVILDNLTFIHRVVVIAEQLSGIKMIL